MSRRRARPPSRDRRRRATAQAVRWGHPADEAADAGNSLFVTFELSPSGSGTAVQMTEVGFRERGWEIAVLEREYNSHIEGWELFLPRLVAYAAKVGAGR
ncbi:SRPBCC domain-containing protein [Streptomyces lydicus]